MDISVIDKKSPIRMGENWSTLLETPCAFEERFDWLVSNTVMMAEQAVTFCDQCYQRLVDVPPMEYETNHLPYQIATFLWAEQAKMLLLLLRDALFEEQKAALLHRTGRLVRAQQETLWFQTKQTIHQALQRTQENSHRAAQDYDDVKRAQKWKHQENPWPTYKKQIRTIVQQTQDLAQDYLILDTIQDAMDEVNALVDQTAEHCLNDLKTNNDTIDRVINLVVHSNNKPTQALAQIREITHKIGSAIYITTFKERLEFLLRPFDIKIKPIVGIKAGILQRRDFAPQRNTTDWFESEVYPLLYEVWELTDQGTSGLRMILLNMTNGLDVLQRERPDALFAQPASLIKPLETFQKDLATLGEDVINLIQLIHKRVDKELQVTCLFDTQRPFLSVSLQSNLNRRIWNQQHGWLARGQRVVATVSDRVEAWWQRIQNNKSLSISEHIARCIQSRQEDEDNRHYTNIFLTKGYVGESFMVGREAEFERFEQLVHNWWAGFRGAALLTGDRFSGKTVFGEIVARRFFPNNFYSLHPNTALTIEGRKMQTSYDLGEALGFVIKHARSKKSLVWIDDLEVWWDPKVPFYQNTQRLMECIDAHSNRLFFMVATNAKIQQQLSHFTHTERIFQAELDLNQLSRQAVQQAIAIRHGATQKKLVNAKGEQLTPKAFDRLARKIYKNAAGNIGEALLQWAHSTYYVDENTVEHRSEAYRTLPSFLTEDSHLILDVLLLHKRANEYRLQKLLGAQPFNERYATVIRRLLNVGVLRRQLDGFIEIETTIVNDLKQLLDQ